MPPCVSECQCAGWMGFLICSCLLPCIVLQCFAVLLEVGQLFVVQLPESCM